MNECIQFSYKIRLTIESKHLWCKWKILSEKRFLNTTNLLTSLKEKSRVRRESSLRKDETKNQIERQKSKWQKFINYDDSTNRCFFFLFEQKKKKTYTLLFSIQSEKSQKDVFSRYSSFFPSQQKKCNMKLLSNISRTVTIFFPFLHFFPFCSSSVSSFSLSLLIRE